MTERASAGDVSARLSGGDDVSSQRLRQLARVIAELAVAPDFETVVDVAVAHAGDATGAIVATLSVLDGETMRLVGIHGGSSTTPRKWGTYPVGAEAPAAQAVRERRIITLAGRASILTRYPSLAGDVNDERSVVCLPLLVRQRALGAIGLVFAGIWKPAQSDLEFLGTFADTCAQALDRLRALDSARANAAKLQFLADTSVVLASSLDFHTTLANVARLAVPTLADWCSVEMVEDGQLRTLVVAHVDPEKVALAEKLQKRFPTDHDASHGAGAVLRTGRSELLPRITDDMLVALARDDEHLALARSLALRSALIVPLIARGRVLGVLSLIWAESNRTYGPDDVGFAEDIARRAAIAIDNAQLHSQISEAALNLQRAALPESLPSVAGWEMAARYLPAGRTEVGGDFYDAIECGEGDVVLVVGDVMGRGVSAAATMAQMRSAVRAYAVIDPEPKTVLHKLDRLFGADDIAQLVTLIYLITDRNKGELTIANAGHLPPLLIGEAGARLVEIPASLPLGVRPEERQVVTIPFPAGATVLAYTDGLVERRDEDIDVGLARAREYARVLAGAPLETAVVALVEKMRDARLVSGDASDDVTVLALRRLTAR